MRHNRFTRRMPFVGCLFFAFAFAQAVCGGEKDSVAHDPKLRSRVEALIARLGAESFDAREAAERKIYELGDRLLFEPKLVLDLGIICQPVNDPLLV